MYAEWDYTRQLKRYDKSLYARKNSKGTMCIWCDRKVAKYFDYGEGAKIGVIHNEPYMVMALTDTWSVSGSPIPWGIDVVMNRLKASDLARNEDLFKDIEKQDEKLEESSKRDVSNTIESFLYDFRGQFKKTFNDYRIV